MVRLTDLTWPDVDTAPPVVVVPSKPSASASATATVKKLEDIE